MPTRAQVNLDTFLRVFGGQKAAAEIAKPFIAARKYQRSNQQLAVQFRQGRTLSEGYAQGLEKVAINLGKAAAAGVGLYQLTTAFGELIRLGVEWNKVLEIGALGIASVSIAVREYRDARLDLERVVGSVHEAGRPADRAAQFPDHGPFGRRRPGPHLVAGHALIGHGTDGVEQSGDRTGAGTWCPLADYLVLRGVPFREAHRIAGRAVRRAIELQISLNDLPFYELQALSPKFEADVRAVFDYESSIDRRNAIGGTGREAVRQQLAEAKQIMSNRAF